MAYMPIPREETDADWRQYVGRVIGCFTRRLFLHPGANEGFWVFLEAELRKEIKDKGRWCDDGGPPLET